MRRLALAASVWSLVLVGGCLGGSGTPRDEPTYRPVPDQELFAQVEDLPGVASADLEYVDTFSNPNLYTGRLHVRSGADPVEVLDRATAVLWQGRPDVSVSLEIPLGGGKRLDSGSVRLQFPEDFEQRYGSQPGTGTVPPDAAPLDRPDGV